MRLMSRAVLVVAVAVAGLVATPGVAHAADGVWVPPSWVTVSAGDSSTARSALGGGTWSVAAPGAQTGVNAAFVGTNSYLRVHVVSFDSVSPTSVTVTVEGWAGSMGWNPGSYFVAECKNGYTYQVSTNATAVASGTGSFTRTFTWYWPNGTNNGCVNVQGGMAAWRHTHYANPNIIDDPDARAATGAGSATTEITCRNVSTGIDTVYSETSTSGSAPAPVCPAGSISVRVKVTVNGVVVQDISMSANWSEWSDYVSGGGGYAVPGVGGVPCILGMQCSIDPWWQSPSPPPLNADCWLNGNDGSQMQLLAADCQTASNEGAVQTGESTGETDNGTDLNPLMRLLEGLASGVTKAINAVKSAVNAVRTAINNVGSAIQGTINSITDRIISAINAVKDVIESGFAGMAQLLHDLLGGDGDGTGGTTGPSHDVPGNAGGIADKFGPWTSLLSGLAGGLSESGSCQGPPLVLNLAGETHTLYLLDACGERATLAFWSRTFITLGLVVTAIMSTIRVFSSAIGLQLRGGD